MPRRGSTRPPLLEPNLTPMVDVVFLLIVFFIVVAQITTSERLDLTLPRLRDAPSVEPGDERRVVLNVAPRDQRETLGGAYLVAGDAFADDLAGVGALTDRLAALVARDPGIAVTVRADRAEAYERVHTALRACAEAGVARVNLVSEPLEFVR